MIAVRIKQMQSFMGVMQMIVMPMFFISGALFPVAGLPAWLTILNRLDPLTYAVDPMRQLVFSHLTSRRPRCRRSIPASPGSGWHVPALLEAASSWSSAWACSASRSGSSARPSSWHGRPR